MSKQNPSKAAAQAALGSLLALTALTGCSGKSIACHHISKSHPDKWIASSKGLCGKIADTKVEPLPAGAPKADYASSDYIKCYGIAAAGMNDCGTKTVACAGSIKTARDPSAWIAIPAQVCKAAGGRIVEPADEEKNKKKKA